jgi:hypothetical protein
MRDAIRSTEVRRHLAAIAIAGAAATAILGLEASPVSAECPYIPPWPKITPAITSAREIVVGRVVTDFDRAELHLSPNQGPRDYALRVTHVLRGGAHVGDLLDVQYLLPNWPQIKFSGGVIASCTYLPAAPNEVIALAFDAMQPGGPMRNGDFQWVQPRTRFNAVGVIEASSSRERERVTLRQLQALAALPQTDTDLVPPTSGSTSGPEILTWVAGLLALLFGVRRFGTHREGTPRRRGHQPLEGDDIPGRYAKRP